jgi:hypothetical protein
LPHLLTELQIGLGRAEIGVVMLRELQKSKLPGINRMFAELEKQIGAQRHEMEVLSRDVQELTRRCPICSRF